MRLSQPLKGVLSAHDLLGLRQGCSSGPQIRGDSAQINLFKTVLLYFQFNNDFEHRDKSILEKIKAESKNHLHRFWHAEIRTCFFCKYPIQEYMYLSVRYANSLNILQSFDFVIVDILNTFAEADMFAGHNVAKPFLQSNCLQTCFQARMWQKPFL